MNRLFRTLPILLAASLQIMPLARNLLINPATGSSFAFILRWGIGTAAALGAYDAHSAASNYFTSPTNFIGNPGVFFTNNLTILSSKGDGKAVCTITTNGVTCILLNNQSTNFAMPGGLIFKFFDPSKGTANSLYISISGTPTVVGTNSFHVDLAYAGEKTVPGDFTIKITAAGGSPPIITNNLVDITKVAGGAATFSVTAGGGEPLSYQWIFNTNTPLLNATNASLTLTNLRASQAGAYSVAITNSSGGTNSLQATLTVTNPPPPIIGSPAKNIGGLFQFTFVPVVGLTNSVQTNGVVSGGVWNAFTNIPPPVSTNPITITDPFGSSNRFYRVLVVP
jgi:hypothetical protein